MRRLSGSLTRGALVVWALIGAAVLWGQAPIPALSSKEKAEARQLFQQIQKDPRGPYGAIRWYCNDGRVLPASGAPCGAVHGNQHASPSEAARQLASMNFDLARFLAGMPFERFIDRERNHFWLRQMVMLEFLKRREDGWIYGKTYARRGVRQAEDEERDGRRLLAKLLEDYEWVKRNYLLTMMTARVTPHGLETGNIRRIRSLSAELADEDPRFLPIRGKIHSNPEPADVARVEQYIRERRPANQEGFAKLLKLMRAEYSGHAAPEGWSFAKGAARSIEIRKELSSSGLNGKQRIALTDEQLQLQELAFRALSAPDGARSRRSRLEELRASLRFAAGSGLLSFRELEAFEAALDAVVSREAVTAAEYDFLIQYLDGGAGWAWASVMRELDEVMDHYAVVEPLAAGLVDDVLRSSVALPIANRGEILSRDADAVVGRHHRVLNSNGSRGVRALNPGVAVARMEIIERAANHPQLRADRIYVIPATVANLRPVKGILTLDSGNALSHTQLLAAALGIPNATIPARLLPELREHEGEEVLYAVTPGGTVVLLPFDSLDRSEQARWKKTSENRRRLKLDTSSLDLEDRSLKSLTETSSADSGVRSGPKAANLGQLKRYFPDKVAPGVVIPFGVYHAHLTRPSAGGVTLLDEIRECYNEAEKMRAAGAATAQVRAFVFPQLAGFRERIRKMPLEPWFVDALKEKMREVFGPADTYGVFVRSDTNAEDLPEFSGAGLNLTLPNVVGTQKILQAIKDVWASPFEERAYEWRAEALASSVDVYPSVVLVKTVGTEKSGVMATANLETLDTDEITVNVNEGTAAVVDGGVAESLLLKPDGSVTLLAQARAPYKKMVNPRGGLTLGPTSGSDYVLTAGDLRQLRALAREVEAEFPAAVDAAGSKLPWDIEFGFLAGKLYLFQIRPLVRYQEAKTIEALAEFEARRPKPRPVRLDKILEAE